MCFFRSKPRLCILADSDEESSSAGSSDEEEAPPSEPQGFVGEKNPTVATEGYKHMYIVAQHRSQNYSIRQFQKYTA